MTKELNLQISSTQPQDQSGDVQDHNSTTSSSYIGPAHVLMNMAKDCTLTKLYSESIASPIVDVFVRKVLCHIVGKRKWNSASRTLMLQQFVDTSDEAMAMLILENNYAKWSGEVEEKVYGRVDQNGVRSGVVGDKSTLYTNRGNKREWSRDGLRRFKVLTDELNKVKMDERHREAYRVLQKHILESETVLNESSKRKRRVSVMDPSIFDELGEAGRGGRRRIEQEEQELEAFLANPSTGSSTGGGYSSSVYVSMRGGDDGGNEGDRSSGDVRRSRTGRLDVGNQISNHLNIGAREN